VEGLIIHVAHVQRSRWGKVINAEHRRDDDFGVTPGRLSSPL
jgi:hypothetical protein